MMTELTFMQQQHKYSMCVISLLEPRSRLSVRGVDTLFMSEHAPGLSLCQ